MKGLRHNKLFEINNRKIKTLHSNRRITSKDKPTAK